VFSPDEQYLAYAAPVGLHIADLSKKTSSLIWENDLERLSLDQIIEIYIPLSWSADQNWLTVWVSGWESGWLGLASLSNLQIVPLSGCSGGEWSPVDPTLAMIVRYDGYLLCGGEQDGIYIVSMAADGIDEKRIYHDPEPSSLNESVGANYLSWSPDNTQLLFVQENESRHPARLMLVSPDGTEAKQLVEVPNGKILSPLWEHNSERVYYVEQVEDVSSVYEVHLATLNKRLIYSATSSDQLLSLSPDNQWLVLAPRNPFENTNLLLLNINGETTIPLRTNTPNAAIGWQHLEEK
jgi:Tol biopolymer transport system component